jgi:predicted secreted protein
VSITSALAIYFVLWWIVLFAVLPFGVRSQIEAGEHVEGSDPGAPAVPRMLLKLFWTTVISGVIFGIAAYAYQLGWLNVERLSRLMGLPL